MVGRRGLVGWAIMRMRGVVSIILRGCGDCLSGIGAVLGGAVLWVRAGRGGMRSNDARMDCLGEDRMYHEVEAREPISSFKVWVQDCFLGIS